MNVILTNNKIYNYADGLMKNFSNQNLKLPIKINFYLQKNQLELLTLAQEIEKQRIYKVKLKDFGNLELTSGQMQALLFMIEEEDEENNE